LTCGEIRIRSAKKRRARYELVVRLHNTHNNHRI
jgi:hypothetical protein